MYICKHIPCNILYIYVICTKNSTSHFISDISNIILPRIDKMCAKKSSLKFHLNEQTSPLMGKDIIILWMFLVKKKLDRSRERISIKHLCLAKSPPMPYVTSGGAATELLNHLLIH